MKKPKRQKTVKLSTGKDVIRMLEEKVRPHSQPKFDLPHRQILRGELQKLLEDFHAMRIALEQEGYLIEGYKRHRVRIKDEERWNAMVAEEGKKMKRRKQRKLT